MNSLAAGRSAPPRPGAADHAEPGSITHQVTSEHLCAWLAHDRTTGNQRRYHGDELCRVAMIRPCQRVDLPVAEIRTALAELPKATSPGPRTGTAWPSGCGKNCVTASTTSTAPSRRCPQTTPPKNRTARLLAPTMQPAARLRGLRANLRAW